jgi:hypothetical protein
VEVWEENWFVIQLYRRFASQWRVGSRGASSLDMTIFFHELDRKGVNETEYDDTIAKLSVIEDSALVWIHRS